jgi:hypothetical protein
LVEPKEQKVFYNTIGKYTFYEFDETKVRVVLELPGIGKVNEKDIFCRFLTKSLELKVHNYNGKNWLFAVPRT